MSSFTNAETLLQQFMNDLDKSDLYGPKLEKLEKFKKYLAEFVKKQIPDIPDEQNNNSYTSLLYGDNFGKIEDEYIKSLINSIKKAPNFHTNKTLIQALSDLLQVAMEGGPGTIDGYTLKAKKAISKIGLNIVNKARVLMGYAELPGPAPELGVPQPEMSDGDVILAYISLEHDANSEDVLNARGLTTPPENNGNAPENGEELIKEIKKIIYQKKIINRILVEQPGIDSVLKPFKDKRKHLIEAQKIYGKQYTDALLSTNAATMGNIIKEFLERTSPNKRSIMMDLEQLLTKMKNELDTNIGDSTVQDAKNNLINDIIKLEGDIKQAKTEHNGAYFHQRVFSSKGYLARFVKGSSGGRKLSPLRIFMQKIEPEEIKQQQLGDKIIFATKELLKNRDGLRETLENENIFSDISDLELDQKESEEMKETIITLILNRETETIREGVIKVENILHEELNLNDFNGNNFNALFNHHQDEENGEPQLVRQRTIGGKRNKTAKKNNKKSKATKKMKKIKKTMKRKTGKKAKKTSRRRR